MTSGTCARSIGGSSVISTTGPGSSAQSLASDAGFTLDWQHLDADRNIAASAAIMGGDPAPMQMLDELIREP